MLSFVRALPAGNAVQMTLLPPAGAVRCRVLRKPSAYPSGPADQTATVVHDGTIPGVLTDTQGLVNGSNYNYRIYYKDAANDWLAFFDDAAVTPRATYLGDTIDPQAIVRDRIAAGVAEETRRGVFKPKDGKFPVITAPYAMAGNISFPVISVHLESDAPGHRFIGEGLLMDERAEDGSWVEGEGWFTRTVLNVIGASTNMDERMAMRRALRRIIQANLGIFSALGLMEVEFSQKDYEESADERGTVVYMTVGSFSCLAPAYVTNGADAISDITVQAYAQSAILQETF